MYGLAGRICGRIVVVDRVRVVEMGVAGGFEVGGIRVGEEGTWPGFGPFLYNPNQ